jgi:hypothetical protein
VSRNLIHRFTIACTIGLLAVVSHIAGADDNPLISISNLAFEADGDVEPTTQPVSYQRCTTCRQDNCRSACGETCLARRWDGKFEVGLNGAEGNSRNVNMVIGFDAKRERCRETTTIDIDYLYSKDDVETTKNRLYSLTRYEYDVPNSNGGLFFDNWFEHDALEDFRARIGFHAGWFETLMKTKDCELKGLVGVGTTKEFEGDDTDWKPELYLGTAWEREINDRQDVYVRAIFLPDFTDFSSFRLRIKAGWDFALNEAESWKLSLSMFDRYDSTPSGSDRKNDVDYWASLAYSF